jgi:hypothetical protein
MFFEGKKEGAHRVSYRLHKGEIPDGMHVLHTCDNMLCVNPDHLFLGTPQDNMADRDRKGRNPRGTEQGMSKLNDQSVREIRARYAAGGIFQHELAEMYGVCKQLIQLVCANKIWRHVA